LHHLARFDRSRRAGDVERFAQDVHTIRGAQGRSSKQGDG
jgi:hypothetical protein